MPHSPGEINALFATLRVEWNTSEELVKTAEQVCGDAIIPSIKEFRYAGRRMVDAFHEIAEAEDYEKAKAYVQDAIFNCHCARHDAIDVATGIIAETLAAAVKTIGYQHILAAYPQFAELRQHLSTVQRKIRASRSDRTNRDAIYQSVHDADFPRLVELYQGYLDAEDIMKSLAGGQRREMVFLRVTTAISTAIALASAGFLGYQTLHPSEPKTVYVTVVAPSPHATAPKPGA